MESELTGCLPEILVIDLPEVDAQHEEIFRRIESLKTACFEDDCLPINQVDGLLEFLAHHYATEERIAEQAGLEFTLHARIHRINLRSMKKGLDEVHHGVRDVHSFLRYVEFWFERHILEHDKPFFVLLQSAAQLQSRPPRRFVAAQFSASI